MFELKTLLYVALGALAGFGYYRFVGCRSGACPIWTSPVSSTLYGAFMGYLLSGGGHHLR